MKHPLIGRGVAIRRCDACGGCDRTILFGIIEKVGRYADGCPRLVVRMRAPGLFRWIVTPDEIESIED